MESSSFYFSPFSVLTTTLVTILFAKLLSLLYTQQTYWRNKGVPNISSVPVFGSGWRVLFRKLAFPDYCKMVYNRNKECRYIGLLDFATPALVIRDPDLIRDISVKNFEHFTDHRGFVDEEIDPIIGKNVFSLKGERWREMRNTLSPSFTASKMRFMFELVSSCSRQFADYLAEHPEFSSEMETKDAFTRYTTDVIATVAFGIGVNSLTDRKNEFFMKGGDAASFGGTWRLLKFLLFRLSPTLSKMAGLTFLSKSTLGFFQRIVSETVKMREEHGLVRPDMIHLLVQAKDQEARDVTIDDIVAQAFIFFLAGFDTSSTLMCYMVQELVANPDVQEKLREEVDRYMEEGNGQISYEAMSKMEYMDMVMNETLRMYPPVVFIDRVCVKEYELPPSLPGHGNCKIEKGTIVWFPVYGLHHDPRYFPEPEKFIPERFSEENKDNILPYTYMPFGLGPRKCIGNRFALMETKILLVHLLHKFVLKPTKKTRIPTQFSKKSFTLLAEGGFWVGLEKRKC